MKDNIFFKGKKVFITGHTGFKGSWMSKLLLDVGAEIMGYSLEPDEEQILFKNLGIKKEIRNVFEDIRDYYKLEEAMRKFQPEIVIHMAAQPIVREGYRRPLDTYSTNVMGTVNLMEAVRNCACVKSVVNVTTDKVYKNVEQEKGYVEDDILNGYDPYSNSKSCSELVTSSYVNSYFRERGIAVSTCRAGNVIGGGDFSKDRIIPDCYRAAANKKDIILRNPDSIRPYQHVLDPVMTYLMLAHKQFEDINIAGAYNIGPDNKDNIKTADIARLFCAEWGDGLEWKVESDNKAPHEANYLYLDCSKIKRELGWHSVWSIEQAIKYTVEWYRAYLEGENVTECMERQIEQFAKDGGKI